MPAKISAPAPADHYFGPDRGNGPGLMLHHYRTLYADPPWRFSGGTKGRPQHYPRMTFDEIKAMPVADLAHPEGCRLLLWITMPLMNRTQELLKAWGFRYSTARVWAKMWPSADTMFIHEREMARGTGLEVIGNAEILVIGKRGKTGKPVKLPPSVFFAQRRQHSRKPDMVRDEALRIYKSPHAELFARSGAEGWDAWGSETTKFPS